MRCLLGACFLGRVFVHAESSVVVSALPLYRRVLSPSLLALPVVRLICLALVADEMDFDSLVHILLRFNDCISCLFNFNCFILFFTQSWLVRIRDTNITVYFTNAILEP